MRGRFEYWPRRLVSDRLRQDARQFEGHRFSGRLDLVERDIEPLTAGIDHTLHKVFRRAGPGGQAEG